MPLDDHQIAIRGSTGIFKFVSQSMSGERSSHKIVAERLAPWGVYRGDRILLKTAPLLEKLLTTPGCRDWLDARRTLLMTCLKWAIIQNAMRYTGSKSRAASMSE